MLLTVNFCTALGMLIWASLQDIKDHTIPVLCIGLGGLLGIVWAVARHGVHGIIESLIGAAIGLLLGLVIRRIAHLGEGDVLLYMTLGVILGPTTILYIFLFSHVLTLVRYIPVFNRKQEKRFAFAPYILFGTILACSFSTIHY